MESFDDNFDGNNSDWSYLGLSTGDYPQALPKGTLGGTVFSPPSGLIYDPLQDTSDYQSGGTTRRANRLIDHDSGVDEVNWNPPAGDGYFDGLGGVPHYVGFQIGFDTSTPALNYGWIGVRITDDATASGELIGYAYETQPLTPILLGFHVPEPATMGIAALGGVTMAGAWLGRAFRRK